MHRSTDHVIKICDLCRLRFVWLRCCCPFVVFMIRPTEILFRLLLTFHFDLGSNMVGDSASVTCSSSLGLDFYAICLYHIEYARCASSNLFVKLN